MLSERSTQRIVLGGWNAVSSNSRLVLTPASLTVLAKRVPTPTGPSLLLRISSTRGLKSLSFSPSARKAKTSSIGRSTTAVPWKRPPAMGGLYGVAGFPFTTFASSSASAAAAADHTWAPFPREGKVSLSWFAAPAGTRATLAAKKPVLLARATGKSGNVASVVELVLRPTTAGKRLLRSAHKAKRSVRVSSVASFAPQGGTRTTRRAGFRLKR